MLFAQPVHNFQSAIAPVCYYECFPSIIIAELALVHTHCKDLCTISHTISTSSSTQLHTMKHLLALIVAHLTVPLLEAIILLIKPVLTIGLALAIGVLTFIRVGLASTEVALAVTLTVIAVERWWFAYGHYWPHAY